MQELFFGEIAHFPLLTGGIQSNAHSLAMGGPRSSQGIRGLAEGVKRSLPRTFAAGIFPEISYFC
jgi:hypothetical protein